MSPLSGWLARYDELGASLRLYRVIFAGWILVGAVPTGAWLKWAPEALLFPPPGTPYLVGSVPPPWAVDAASLLLAIFASLLLVGLHVRLASLSIAILLLILNTWMYAFGKVDHDFLLVAVCLLLAFSGWGRKKTEQAGAGRNLRGWPTAFLALVTGLGMLSAALPKLFTGWLSLDVSASRHFFLQNHYVTGRSAPLTDLFMGLESPLFWLGADIGTVLLEAGMIFLIFSPRTFRIACALAAIFHLGIWLLMGITFVHNVVAYAAFVRWSPLYRYRTVALVAGQEGGTPRWLTPAALAGGAGFGLLLIGLGDPLADLDHLTFGHWNGTSLVLLTAGVASLLYLLAQGVRFSSSTLRTLRADSRR